MASTNASTRFEWSTWFARLFASKRVVATVVSLLLIVHAGLLAWSATQHSPTLNEPAHLVAGLTHWKFGRFDVYRVNPPLVHYVAAIPVVLASHKEDWSGFYEIPGARPEFQMGEDFIKANGERSIWLFTIGRWACIPFSLALGLFCFCWSRELWGSASAGLISMFLWCFEPNFLAHGELITPDCAASALGLGAGYLFWRWLKQPTWGRALAAGFVLALAELTKTSWIILFGLWPLLWCFWQWTEYRRQRRDERDSRSRPQAFLAWNPMLQLASILFLALYILNLGYRFDGSFTNLKDFTFVSKALTGLEKAGDPGNRFQRTWLGHLPVPVPKQYLRGIDLQKKDFEHYGQSSYLRGEWKDGGWWYYYVYGLAVKTPHGSQLLLLLASFTVIYRILRRRQSADSPSPLRAEGPDDGPRATETKPPQPVSQPAPATARDLVVLLTPAVILLVLVSSHLEFNHHIRYALPVLGFAYVFAGAVAWWFQPQEQIA